MAKLVEFTTLVRKTMADKSVNQIAYGKSLLQRSDPSERALGAVLLFFANGLDEATMRNIAKDSDLLVPFVLFDWIRDYGLPDEIAAFDSILTEQKIPPETLSQFLMNTAGLPGGGRSALELYLRTIPEEGELDALSGIVESPKTAYDVRMQSLLKLLEPENRKEGIELLLALDKKDGSLLSRAADIHFELAHLSDEDEDEVPYKVWDAPLRDIAFMAKSNYALAVRDMANYVEYALHRDDADFEPVVEEGSFDAAKSLLDQALHRRSHLSAEEWEAVDRLANNLERLKQYDPAYIEDSAEDQTISDYADDEEVPVEVLDEEDAYYAAFLEEQENGEEEDEEDEDPPGLTDEEVAALEAGEDDEDEDEDDEDNADDEDDAADEDDEDNADDADDEDDADDVNDEKDDADGAGDDGNGDAAEGGNAKANDANPPPKGEDVGEDGTGAPLEATRVDAPTEAADKAADDVE